MNCAHCSDYHALPILIFYSHFVAITFIANTDKKEKREDLLREMKETLEIKKREETELRDREKR